MPIKGLNALHRSLEDAKRALAALEGQFGSVRFVPSDAESVRGAIASLEAMIDEKLLPFRGNAIVESLIPQLKEKIGLGFWNAPGGDRLIRSRCGSRAARTMQRKWAGSKSAV